MENNIYSRGKIYKLVCGDLTYFGSTVQPLCARKAQHTKNYKSWLKGENEFVTSYGLFGGDDKPEVILVEDFPCERKEHLPARERWYIENNECVNKRRPIISREEKNEYNRTYHAEHREQICERHKLHRLKDIDNIRAKDRERSRKYRAEKKLTTLSRLI